MTSADANVSTDCLGVGAVTVAPAAQPVTANVDATANAPIQRTLLLFIFFSPSCRFSAPRSASATKARTSPVRETIRSD
ncbi:hypothetical protein RZO50_14570 [Microbacterium sp. SSW1-59]|uniref:hypothetical protein n=1 Tax=Microbacterium xanthum TaxID=3079794 RepID=UPI002AD45FA0|nr:hypothetical protein [Microbacterium sp. SSW1-59]MDZ8202742.1 hypothetical protein [Microbacterium sp. SSW1-59]